MTINQVYIPCCDVCGDCMQEEAGESESLVRESMKESGWITDDRGDVCPDCAEGDEEDDATADCAQKEG